MQDALPGENDSRANGLAEGSDCRTRCPSEGAALLCNEAPLMGEQSRAMHVTEGETQSITSTSAISRHRPSPARHGSSQTILNIRVGPCLSPGLHFLPPRAALAPTGAFAVRRFSSFHHSGHSFMQLQQHPHHSLRHQRGKTAIKPKSHPASNQNGTALRSNRRNTPLSTSQRRKTTS